MTCFLQGCSCSVCSVRCKEPRTANSCWLLAELRPLNAPLHRTGVLPLPWLGAGPGAAVPTAASSLLSIFKDKGL